MIRAHLHFKSKQFNLQKLCFAIATIVILISECTYGQCDSLPASSFVGNWKISRLIEVAEGEPGPEGTETSYPDTLFVICNKGLIKANYIDQFGRHGSFNTLLDNRGNDLILAFSDLTTKDPESFSMIHHVKVFGDSLQGVTLGQMRHFEWRAAKFNYKKPDSEKKK